MKPKSAAWPALLALLVLLGLNGCRTLPPAPPPTAVASAEELLARLQAREKASAAFQARGRITFLSPERNYSGTALIKAQRPSSLKVDILDILGRSLLSFASDGAQVQVLSPSEGKFFHGKATPRNLAAFIPPSVSLPQTLRLLTGALPLSQDPPFRFDYDPAAGQYLLEWRKDNKLEERLWVTAQGLYPVKEEYFGGADQPRFTAELADYGQAAPDLPGKITLKTEAPKLELRLTYSELRPNPPLTPADLTLPPPPGVTVLQLP
jgi:outer membrane lipoprotein-sorting protein